MKLLCALVLALASAAGAAVSARSGAPAYRLSIAAGDRQRVIMQAGAVAFAPLVVSVTDARGKKAAGVPVRFVCVAPHLGCYFGSPHGGVSATISTGRDGRAILGSGKAGVFVYWTGQLYTRRNPSQVSVVASLPSGAQVKFGLVPINPYSFAP